VRAALPDLPLHVLVRPRGGDFVYSADELGVMRSDIAACAACGAAGVALGALRLDGAVDEAALAALVAHAQGAGVRVTFHRAIDAARDPLEALRACLALRVDRVLSSGQAATAPQGARVLAQMARLAEEEAAAAAAAARECDAGSAPPPRLVVMAGSGVTAANAAALAAETGVRELHGSARVPAAAAPAAAGSAAAAAAMAAACAKLGFGAQPPQATEESVRAILDALR
jgi:copper homeostasis protein